MYSLSQWEIPGGENANFLLIITTKQHTQKQMYYTVCLNGKSHRTLINLFDRWCYTGHRPITVGYPSPTSPWMSFQPNITASEQNRTKQVLGYRQGL